MKPINDHQKPIILSVMFVMLFFATSCIFHHMSPMKGMRHEMMMSGRLPSDIKPENLPDPSSSGAKLLNNYCTDCHNLPSPLMHTDEEWPVVLARMISLMDRMGSNREMMEKGMMRGMMDIRAPSKEEERTILSYLKRNALKPASLDTLGPADDPGLKVFRKSCSQCHALPDPKIHTAEEWPEVVERMRKNMEIMGKPLITDNERDEIISFLNMKTENGG